MHRNIFYTKRNVKISVWNINGLMCKGVNKYQDGEFIEKLVGYDIFCLQETHCDLNNSLELSEFPRPVHIIRSRLKDTGKIHGGLSVYIRNSIRTGIKFLNHTTNDCIWLKLCKDFFNNPHDIFLCFLYAPPENSTYSKRIDYDIWVNIKKWRLLKFQKLKNKVTPMKSLLQYKPCIHIRQCKSKEFPS